MTSMAEGKRKPPTPEKGKAKIYDAPDDINEIRLGADDRTHDRRVKVARLRWVQKWTITQIAQALDTPERTIYRDLAKIREINAKAREKRGTLKQDTNTVLAQLEMTHAERQRERWQEYHNNKNNPALRRRLLNDIAEEEERFVKLLQSMGVVEKAPDEVNVNQTTETWKERIARLKAEREAFMRGVDGAAQEAEE